MSEKEEKPQKFSAGEKVVNSQRSNPDEKEENSQELNPDEKEENPELSNTDKKEKNLKASIPDEKKENPEKSNPDEQMSKPQQSVSSNQLQGKMLAQCCTMVPQGGPVPGTKYPYFGPYPVHMTCFECHADIITLTYSTPGILTWLCVGCLFCIGCFLGCCLIPLCVQSLKDIEHVCPSCNTYLGTFRRI